MRNGPPLVLRTCRDLTSQVLHSAVSGSLLSLVGTRPIAVHQRSPATKNRVQEKGAGPIIPLLSLVPLVSIQLTCPQDFSIGIVEIDVERII